MLSGWLVRVSSMREDKDRLEKLADLLGHQIVSAEEALGVLASADPVVVESAKGLLDAYMGDSRVAGAVKELAMDPVMGALISLRYSSLEAT